MDQTTQSDSSPQINVLTPESSPPTGPSLPPEISAEELQQQRKIVFAVIGVVVVILVIIIGAVIFLIQPSTDTERIRDVFIIMIAAMTLLLGFVLVILIIQLARLINLLQNEIRPILEATNETTRTLRGTAVFMSEHLSEPVIKVNESMAGIQRFMELINPGKSKK